MDYVQRFTSAEWPQSSPFREEYQRRVAEEFDASPLHNFVTDLRNLILQKRLPVSTTAESWEQGNGWRFQVMLDADLLGWDGWSAQARKYIKASGDSVDLSRTVSAYTSAVITFDGGWPSASSKSMWRRSSPTSTPCMTTERWYGGSGSTTTSSHRSARTRTRSRRPETEI